MRTKIDWPIGSIISGTMRLDDLIPTFVDTLSDLAANKRSRAAHRKLVSDIGANMTQPNYYESGLADDDLDQLFDALGEYAAPYFYFGAHPDDGADYGYWLSEAWNVDFTDLQTQLAVHAGKCPGPASPHLLVSGLAEVPSWFRGELAVVNDHGNVTLYVKTSRAIREVWGIV